MSFSHCRMKSILSMPNTNPILHLIIGLLISIFSVSAVNGATQYVDSGNYLAQTLEGRWNTIPDPDAPSSAQLINDPQDELVILATKLNNDPKTIFQWVYNNITYEENYSGSRLGAYGSYIAGRGNQWDVSTLLLTLLRISNVEARYAILADEKTIFVEANIPQENYRGVGTSGQKVWVPLVAWTKQFSETPGIELFPNKTIPTELGFDFDAYLQTINQKTALEEYEEKVQAYINTNFPGKNITDVSGLKRQKPYPSSVLPLSLPLTFDNSVITRFTDIPAEKRIAATLKVKKSANNALLLETTVYLSEIAGKRFSLDFIPATSADATTIAKHKSIGLTPTGAASIKPVLKIDGDVFYTGTASLKTGDYFYISYDCPGFINKVRTKQLAGAFTQIAFDPLSASIKTIEKLKIELGGLTTKLVEDDATREQYLGRVSKIISDSYLNRYFVNNKKVEALFNGVVGWDNLTPTFISTFPRNFGGSQSSKFLLHPQWMMDAQNKAVFFHRAGDLLTELDWNDPYFTFIRKLAGFSASYNESLVFEDWQDTPSLSTIKGLMIANGDPELEIRQLDATHIPELENLRYRQNFSWNSLSSADWDAIVKYMYETQDWGTMPAVGSSDYTYRKNEITTMCKNGSIPISHVEHLLRQWIPEDSLTDESINQLIGYLNESATVQAPLTTISHKNINGSVQLVTGPDYDGYYFSMNDGSIPTNGSRTSAEVENDPTLTGWDHAVSSYLSDYTVNSLEKTYSMSSDPGSSSGSSPSAGYSITTADLGNQINAVLTKVGDPVDMVNGEFYVQEQPDFLIKSRGLTLAVVRKYRNQAIYNGPFGFGWTWNHGERLMPLAGGNVNYYDANGKPQKLTNNGDKTFKVPQGSTYTMQRVGRNYVLTRRDLITYHFNREGYLIKKADPFGNQLQYIYGDITHPDRITKITDSLNRNLTFSFTPEGKVEKITDFNGREYFYTYDGDDLITATDLENNTTTYEYLKDQENPLNNHNLSHYTLPNDDAFEIGYYKNDQVAYHSNAKGHTFNFLYSRLNGYSETWNEGGYYRKVFFDENNNVTRVDNEDGTIIKKAYDEHHNVTSFTDGNGFTTTYDFGLNPQERLLLSKTNALGATWSYRYESENNPFQPSATTNPLGIENNYTYYPTGRLHQQINGVGYDYDNTGLLTAQGAKGATSTFSYDSYGNVTSITNPAGATQYFEYDEGKGLDLLRKIDPNGYVTSFIYYEDDNQHNMPPGMIKNSTIQVSADLEGDGGFTTTFEYNHYNQMTKAIDALGNITVQEYDVNRQPVRTLAANGAIYENLYDSARSLVQSADILTSIDPLGSSEFFQYDELGNVIQHSDKNGNTSRFAYDGMNRLIEETDPYQNSVYFSYDGNGNLVQAIDKKGSTNTIVYDANGQKVSETDALGNITSYDYDAIGRLTLLTDAKGVKTVFTYDALNRLVEKIVGHLSTDSRTFQYRYDRTNNLIQEILPLGNSTSYEYDASGNKLAQKHYDHHGTLLKTIENLYYQDSQNLLAKVIVDGGKDNSGNGTSFEYDALGRPVAQIDPLGHRVETMYDEVGNPNVVSTPAGMNQYVYDINSRLVKAINPLNETIITEYDANGNATKQHDPEGNITSLFYDSLNRKIGTQDALGNETLFDYDCNSNLTQLTDANEGVTYFKYDENNQKITETRPMGQKTHTYYNELGQLDAVIHGAGNKIRYSYNNLGQPNHIEYFKPEDYANPAKVVDYTYDNNGNLSSYSDGITSATYTFDDLHRKTEETVNYPTFSKSYSYNYPNNWQRGFAGPDGVEVTSNFDEASRLSSINIPGQGQFDYTDYKWNRPQTITLPGNTTINRTYDALQRIQSIITKGAGNNLLTIRDYEYSKVGNVISKSTEHGLYTYQYDELSRLTFADNPTGIADENFSYDAVGNRITDDIITGSLTYNKNNELISLGADALSYDLNGNMVENPWSQRQQKYEYDVTIRLSKLKDNNQNVIAEYYYDPFGRRLWKDVAGVKTYFFYSEEGLIGEYDTNGNELKSYGYLPGSQWTTNPLYQKENGNYYYYLNDHIGTPQKMVDDTGHVVWAARYDSFGNATVDVEEVVNNLGFSGQYWDAESGLYYNWNRYYDPLLGRYIQSDPLGLDAGLNFYVYTESNPVNMIDPTGLETEGEYQSECYSGNEQDNANHHNERSYGDSYNGQADKRKKASTANAAKLAEMMKKWRRMWGMPEPAPKRTEYVTKRRGTGPARTERSPKPQSRKPLVLTYDPTDDLINRIKKSSYTNAQPKITTGDFGSSWPDPASSEEVDFVGISGDMFLGVGGGFDVGVWSNPTTGAIGFYYAREFGVGRDIGFDVEFGSARKASDFDGDYTAFEAGAGAYAMNIANANKPRGNFIVSHNISTPNFDWSVHFAKGKGGYVQVLDGR